MKKLVFRKVPFEETKVNRVGKNGTILSISRMMNLAISLITSMLLSRFRTLTEYGTFSEITTVVSIAISIICIGLPSCLNYFVPRCDSQEERNQFLSFYYLINTGLGVVTGIVLIIATPIIARYYENDMIIVYSYALAILPLTTILHKSRDNLFVSTNQCVRSIIFNLAQTVSNLGIIILTQVLDRDFSFYFILYIVDNILFAVLIYFEAFRLVDHFTLRFSKSLLKEVLKYSIPLGISSAVATIDLDLDKLIIGRLFSTEDVAVYTNCGKELPIVYIATSFSAVLLPIIVKCVKEKNYKSAVAMWGKTIEFSMIIIAFFTAVCIVFAPQIITILYSEKYLAGVSVFRIYSLVLLFRVTAFAMILQATGKTKMIMLVSALTLVANVGFNILFTYLIGFPGPAVATLITLGMSCILYLLLSSKEIHVSFGSIFPWKRLGLLMLYNLIGAILAYIPIKVFNIGTSWSEILVAVGIGFVWMIAYIAFLWKRIKILWKDMNSGEKNDEPSKVSD